MPCPGAVTRARALVPRLASRFSRKHRHNRRATIRGLIPLYFRGATLEATWFNGRFFDAARVAALVLFLLPALAWSQNPTFNIEGVVTDAQQATLPGVAVTITNTATGLTRTVTTGENGRYVVRALPPEGQYRVQLEIAGFATQIAAEPGLQRRPERGAELRDAAVDGAGNRDGRR